MRFETPDQALLFLISFFLALPVVALFFYFYWQFNPPMWLIWWRLRRAHNPPPAPQRPEKRTRPGWLARLRAKLGVHHRGAKWTIGYSTFIWPASINLDNLRHHTLVCGATGSGKTSALQLLVDAFADKLPIIIVDCKASSLMQHHVAALPESITWTIGGNVTWDPLRGDPRFQDLQRRAAREARLA